MTAPCSDEYIVMRLLVIAKGYGNRIVPDVEENDVFLAGKFDLILFNRNDVPRLHKILDRFVSEFSSIRSHWSTDELRGYDWMLDQIFSALGTTKKTAAFVAVKRELAKRAP